MVKMKKRNKTGEKGGCQQINEFPKNEFSRF